MLFNKENLFFKDKAISIILLLFLSRASIQYYFFMNWDVAYLLYATKLFLNGGSYIGDFFTPNTPMLLLIYSPVVLLQHFFQWSLDGVLLIYTEAIALLSLYLCFSLLKQLRPSAKQFIAVYTVILAYSYMIVPAYDFSQREHLFLLLTLPYVFLVGARLYDDSLQFSKKLLLTIGVMLGVGVMIKPMFILTPFIIELSYLYRKKNILSLLRPETLTAFILILSYGCYVLIAHKPYVFELLPFLLRNYYKSVAYPYFELFMYGPILIGVATILLSFCLKKNHEERTFGFSLKMALVSYILIFYVQRTTFYYHSIPALSLAIFYLTYLVINYLDKNQETKMFIWQLLAMLSLIIPASFLLSIELVQYFLIIFALLPIIYFSQKNKTLILSMFVCFIITILFIFLKYQTWFYFDYKNKVLKPLVLFVEKLPVKERSLRFMAEFGFIMYPLVNEVNAVPCQREDSLIFIKHFLLAKKNHEMSPQLLKDEQFLLNMVADDLQNQKPTLVFVDLLSLPMKKIDPNFNMLDYFSKSVHFKQEWQEYEYLTTLKNLDSNLHIWKYYLAVYKRKLIPKPEKLKRHTS